jgi:hypothetical protein
LPGYMRCLEDHRGQARSHKDIPQKYSSQGKQAGR